MIALRGPALVLLLAIAHPASALDTTEAFEVGATNAEYYLGMEGVGHARVDRVISNEVLLGYGLASRFSASLAVCNIASTETLAAETALCAGLFGNAFESDHFDFDLMLAVEVASGNSSTMGLAPLVELNLDHAPDMSTYGLYVRSGIVTYGVAGEGDALDSRQHDWMLNPGAYYVVNDRIQLLAEYDFAAGLDTGREAEGTARAFALGVNALLTPEIELITELRRDAPLGNTDANYGIALGFIATLPSAR